MQYTRRKYNYNNPSICKTKAKNNGIFDNKRKKKKSTFSNINYEYSYNALTVFGK